MRKLPAIEALAARSKNLALKAFAAIGGVVARPAPPGRFRIAVVLHLHYVDLWEEMRSYLDNIPVPFDLFVTLTDAANSGIQEAILAAFPQARVSVVPNRGRDILPFYRIAKEILAPGRYDLVCKIHSKRTPAWPLREEWRRDLLDGVLLNRRRVNDILSQFGTRARLGMVAASTCLAPASAHWGESPDYIKLNKAKVLMLAEAAGLDGVPDDFVFVAGTMFWCRTAAIRNLFSMPLDEEAFEVEQGQVNGTIAHGFERFLGLLVVCNGFEITGLKTKSHPSFAPNAQAGRIRRNLVRWIKKIPGTTVTVRWLIRQVNRLAELRRQAAARQVYPPEALMPPAGLHMVGNSDYDETGNEFLKYFVELAGLQPSDRVLDLGSGTGRMSRKLVKYLSSGTYDGIDIVQPSVAWCQQAYKDYSNFKFHHADVVNRCYNPGGTCSADRSRLPFPAASFDFIFLTSVFTHMLPSGVENYLREISRVLKPGGRCLITWFLLTEESLGLLRTGASSIGFIHELPELSGCLAADREIPEGAIAYPEAYVRHLYAGCGLKIREPILWGSWCGRRQFLSFQDMIIAAKD